MRIQPITKGMSKQYLPVYDNLMICPQMFTCMTK